VRLDEGPLFNQLEEIVVVRPDMKVPVFSLIDSYENGAVPGAAPIEGALELVAALSRGAKLALVTMQGRATCEALLGSSGMKERFAAVLTREDSLDREDQLLEAVRLTRGDARATLFIGDSANDAVCSRRAGVDFVMVGDRRAVDAPLRFTNLKDLGDALL